MAVPDFQTLMLPVLSACATEARSTARLVEELSDAFGLTPEEREELLPSGKQTRIANRVAWATSYLSQAGPLERPSRGIYIATNEGRSTLQSAPRRIDMKFLERFPAYVEFRAKSGAGREGMAPASSDGGAHEETTPDETIRVAHGQILENLAGELLQRIQSSPPKFFEELIVDLLVKMGYGTDNATARAIGQSGDDGVDGVINLDALGVDQVYFQAKRYAPGTSIGAGALRDFFGALALKDVTKGIFVTTSHFSPSARETAEKLSKRIVLIDGPALARLLIRFSVGCRVTETFPVSVIDESYFE